MKTNQTARFAVVALAASLAVSRAQPGGVNQLANPGFELDGGTVLGWNSYSAGSGNVLSETSGAMAHGGTHYLKVYQAFNGSVNYNGVYQDNVAGDRKSTRLNS